jgi:hypothetical protein
MQRRTLAAYKKECAWMSDEKTFHWQLNERAPVTDK